MANVQRMAANVIKIVDEAQAVKKERGKSRQMDPIFEVNQEEDFQMLDDIPQSRASKARPSDKLNQGIAARGAFEGE